MDTWCVLWLDFFESMDMQKFHLLVSQSRGSNRLWLQFSRMCFFRQNTWLSFELLQCESLDLPLLFVSVHTYYQWTVSICLLKPPWLSALYSHWLQGYLTFLWTDSMWVFRSSIVVCFCSHLLPMNCFYMSLQTSLAWGFIFTLITGIFDFLMDWFNVCLQMTLLWKFLVTQIADYKDVSFSHE